MKSFSVTYSKVRVFSFASKSLFPLCEFLTHDFALSANCFSLCFLLRSRCFSFLSESFLSSNKSLAFFVILRGEVAIKVLGWVSILVLIIFIYVIMTHIVDKYFSLFFLHIQLFFNG